jgi:glycosyltransferase involved in cell wall biosynthesis
LKLALIEPYFGGSHQQWAEGLKNNLDIDTQIFHLKDSYWKWRMHGGAITLAEQYLKTEFQADLILATDMLDLGTFLSLTRKKATNSKVAIYFHENQLAYPWQEHDRDLKQGRDLHYAFINYTSALAADRVFFNSSYNQSSFLEGLEKMLRFYPDNRNLNSIEVIRDKSEVLPLGLDLKGFDAIERKTNDIPVILWNHRWEHDKNPKEFFETLIELKSEGHDFKLIVLGEYYARQPEIFNKAERELKEEIIHFGYVEDFENYGKLLKSADILPVTSIQDFFGISVVEAAYCGAKPLLPKRLAFPELFDDHKVFYENGKLKNSLIQLLTQNDKAAYADANALKRFDWSAMKSTYEEALHF